MMNMYDLATLSDDDLTVLKNDVQAELSTRQTATKLSIIKQIKKVAEGIGASLSDLVQQHSAKSPLAKRPPRYANPDDLQQTWSGRGRQPAWIKSALAAGKTLDTLKI